MLDPAAGGGGPTVCVPLTFSANLNINDMITLPYIALHNDTKNTLVGGRLTQYLSTELMQLRCHLVNEYELKL